MPSKSRLHVGDLSNWSNMRSLHTNWRETVINRPILSGNEKRENSQRGLISEFKRRNPSNTNRTKQKDVRKASTSGKLEFSFLHIYRESRPSSLTRRVSFWAKNDKWREWLNSRTRVLCSFEKEISTTIRFSFYSGHYGGFRNCLSKWKWNFIGRFNELSWQSWQFINIH